jgi:hypothetical protein
MAEDPDVRVSVLEVLVLVVLKAAVTPWGSPESARLTLPLRPTGFAMLINMARREPVIIAVTDCVVADKLKLGAGTTSVTAVELLAVAEVPFTRTV